jgi:hypothetical protein
VQAIDLPQEPEEAEPPEPTPLSHYDVMMSHYRRHPRQPRTKCHGLYHAKCAAAVTLFKRKAAQQWDRNGDAEPVDCAPRPAPLCLFYANLSSVRLSLWLPVEL